MVITMSDASLLAKGQAYVKIAAMSVKGIITFIAPALTG